MINFRTLVTFLFSIYGVTSFGQADSVQLDLNSLSGLEFFKKYSLNETTSRLEDIKITKLIWSLKQVRKADNFLRKKGIRTVTIIENRPSKENPYYIIGHYQLLKPTEHTFRFSIYRVDNLFKIIEFQDLDDAIKDRWKRAH